MCSEMVCSLHLYHVTSSAVAVSFTTFGFGLFFLLVAGKREALYAKRYSIFPDAFFWFLEPNGLKYAPYKICKKQVFKLTVVN